MMIYELQVVNCSIQSAHSIITPILCVPFLHAATHHEKEFTFHWIHSILIHFFFKSMFSLMINVYVTIIDTQNYKIDGKQEAYS